MQQSNPTKEQVRAYTRERAKAKTPPPHPDEVRRQLGWGLTQKQRHECER